MELITELVSKFGECLVSSIGKQCGYLIHYNSNIKDFEEQVEKLGHRRAALQLSIDAARRNTEVIAPDVQSWVNKVDSLGEELERFLEEDIKPNEIRSSGWFPNLRLRYSLSRKAKKKMQELVTLHEEGKFDRVSCPAPTPKIGSSFTGFIKGFKSRTSIMNEVIEALKNDKLNIISICGMGGVGKTTMVKQLIKFVEGLKLFDDIAMATLSQNANVKLIQGEIADSLGLKFEVETESGRARRLHERVMNSKKIFIVFDDVWSELDFEKMGFPFKEEHEGCKILLTSRSVDACQRMGSEKNFNILELPREEAWELFCKTAGNSVEDNLDLHPLAKEVANECAGLPLAIVTIGKALGDKDKHVWADALHQLKKSTATSFTEMHELVYSRIELSYNFLISEEAKSLFLLCCLFPEDFDIQTEYLVRYGMGLGLFGGISTMEQARNRVHAIADKLKGSFLLLDGNMKECVRMHDVVRDAAISIASKIEHGFLVECGAELREWSDSHKACAAISLKSIDMQESSKDFEFLNLKLLQVSAVDYSQKIPDDLFGGMKELRVVTFLNSGFPSLPPSIQVLRHLRTLLLEGFAFKDISYEGLSIIGGLVNLEVLSFYGSEITSLPKEIGLLKNLRVLDLTQCKYLERIPPGTLAGLCRLEELYIGESFCNWDLTGEEEEGQTNASLVELIALTRLMVLDIQISTSRQLPKDFLLWQMLLKNITRFSISIGYLYFPTMIGPSARIQESFQNFDGYKFQNSLQLLGDESVVFASGIYALINRTEKLCLNLSNCENVLNELNRVGFPHLKHLSINEAEDIQYLIDVTDGTHSTNFTLLDSLYLHSLRNLEEICHGQLLGKNGSGLAQLACFRNLKYLDIHECCHLNNVFSRSMARESVQLEYLNVTSCGMLKEVISEMECNKEKSAADDICFPQLKHLTLHGLPQLLGFSKGINEGSEEEAAEIHQITPILDEFEESSSETLEITEVVEHGQLLARRKLFTFFWIQRIQNLHSLDMKRCHSLEVIFDLEGHSVEGSIEIQVLAHLEHLRLSYLRDLTHVWRNVPDRSHGFQNLRDLEVIGCDNLRYLLTPSIAKQLLGLRDIKIESCRMLAYIVANYEAVGKEGTSQIVFPNVHSMVLLHLPNLCSFSSYASSFAWPSLKFLQLEGCYKMRTFGSSPVNAINDNGALDSELRYTDSCESSSTPTRHSCGFAFFPCGCASTESKGTSDQAVTQKVQSNPIQRGADQYLKKEVMSTNLEDSRNANIGNPLSFLTSSSIRGLPALSELKLWHCKSVEVVFDLVGLDVEENHPVDVLNKLRTLRLYSLPKLTHIWKMGTENIRGFQGLRSLQVSSCNNLKILFSPSVAKLLLMLEEIEIHRCETMNEIMGNGAAIQLVDTIIFPRVKSVKLLDLPSLVSFSSAAINIEWPSLTEMFLKGCPKLATFVTATVKTPRLKEVYIDWSKHLLTGDLNVTIQQFIKGKQLLEDHLKPTTEHTLKINTQRNYDECP